MNVLRALLWMCVIPSMCFSSTVTLSALPCDPGACPTVTITSGYLNALGSDPSWLLESNGPPSFSLRGFQDGSFLRGGWIGNAGDLLIPDGLTADLYGGTGTIDGVLYDLRYNNVSQLSGSAFFFSAPSVRANLGKVQFPFTFSGIITAGPSPPVSMMDCILCRVPIEGSGIGTITFREFFPPTTGKLYSSSLTYEFVVPEPGSLWLLPAGILTMAFLQRGLRSGRAWERRAVGSPATRGDQFAEREGERDLPNGNRIRTSSTTRIEPSALR